MLETAYPFNTINTINGNMLFIDMVTKTINTPFKGV